MVASRMILVRPMPATTKSNHVAVSPERVSTLASPSAPSTVRLTTARAKVPAR